MFLASLALGLIHLPSYTGTYRYISIYIYTARKVLRVLKVIFFINMDKNNKKYLWFKSLEFFIY